MPAARRFKSHGQPHGQLITWFGVYASLTPGVALDDAPTVRLDFDNEPQPDAVLMIEEHCGGQARLSNVLTNLQQGLTSPEHKTFVQKLVKDNPSQ